MMTQPASLHNENVSAEQPSRVLRVLVVEDNQDSADSLALLLNLWGHEVQVCSDAPAALRAVPDYQPHVALVDIGLPGMDGCEFMRQLRLQGHGNDVVCVAVTGFGDEAHRQQIRDAGFRFQLLKPYDPGSLHNYIELMAGNPGNHSVNGELPGKPASA